MLSLALAFVAGLVVETYTGWGTKIVTYFKNL